MTRRERDDLAALVRRREKVAISDLLASGLTTDAAKSFLESMASADDLLPALTVEQVQAMLPTGERVSTQDRFAWLSHGHWEPPALSDGEARS